MHRVTIAFPGEVQAEVWTHLRSNQEDEEAAFLFADVETTARATTFHVASWYRVQPEDYEERGIHGIVLTDGCHAAMVKRAHDEGRTLIECHSHPGWRPAVFSPYDFAGFTEFVPHVRWRLKERPYAALVVADDTFDGLAWVEPKRSAPLAVDAITTPNQIFYPTRKSYARTQEVQHEQEV